MMANKRNKATLTSILNFLVYIEFSCSLIIFFRLKCLFTNVLKTIVVYCPIIVANSYAKDYFDLCGLLVLNTTV